MDDPIFVTKPFLPPLSELNPYLEKIWENSVLTNGGPFHNELESRLCEYLGVDHISLFANGTLALITGLQALEITGQVITTPYSFVATAHSLLWNSLEPIFIDIKEADFNLDPRMIEDAITERTTAILPVHCYGNPCDVDEIDKIAKRNGLKVIYDAAHAFGVECHCGSLLNHGDLSVLSFHATKVFNTFEGGAIVCKDKETKDYIDHLKNFGFDNETSVSCNGINGKMNEFQSALGLSQLDHIDYVISERSKVSENYMHMLKDVPGISLPNESHCLRSNHSYFPVLVKDNYPITRDELYEVLKTSNVFTRRYFYPLISHFPMYRHYSSARLESLPIANKISEMVLCLPIYPSLRLCEQSRIVSLIKEIAFG